MDVTPATAPVKPFVKMARVGVKYKFQISERDIVDFIAANDWLSLACSRDLYDGLSSLLIYRSLPAAQ